MIHLSTIYRALHRQGAALHWLHLGVVYAGLFAPIFLDDALGIFLVVTIAAGQNIGLLHEHFHRFPLGPRKLVTALVHGLYWIGGLNFRRGRLAHRLHHAYLGSPRDPDRAGYTLPAVGRGRFRYLFFIGPLRQRFAPVDISEALAQMKPAARARLESSFRFHDRAIRFTHFGLLLVFGWNYLPWLAGLLAANVFSNLREMAEHSENGFGRRLVNVGMSPVSLLLCSGPGFWFHGTHHADSTVPYWSLPLFASERGHPQSGGYFTYLAAGALRAKTRASSSAAMPAPKAT